MTYRHTKRVVTICLAAILSVPIHAQNSQEIVIGASLPLSGPNAAVGKEGLAIAQAIFDQVNAQGGIGGRNIRFKVLDDAFDPAKAADNARKLIDDDRALALFNCWGTASCSAMMPVINELKVPMVSGIAGGGPMRTSPGRYAFNVRPTTDDEITQMVKQMSTIGQDKIAVIFQNDPFGKNGLNSARGVLDKFKLKAVAELPIERDGSNTVGVTEALIKSGANGIVVIASPPPTVKLITEARKGGLATQFYNLAAQANSKLVSDLGPYTAGVIFTTLVPSPWRESHPLATEYRQLASKSSGGANYSFLGMEVFINAQVLVSGLRKAGKAVTRDSLLSALETMPEKDFGYGVRVKYGPTDRDGSAFVGLAIVNAQGRFVQ